MLQGIKVNTAEADYMGKKNSIRKFFGMIFSPGETARDIAAGPGIILPIIVMALTELGFLLSRFDLFREHIKYTMEMGTAYSNIEVTPEQMETVSQFGIISGVVMAPVGALITWLIGTAILFGVVKFFKGAGSFRQFLSLTGYSYIIMVLYFIISAVVSVITGQLYMDTSLALFTNGIKGSFLYGFLRGLEFFVIWRYAAVGTGVAKISGISSSKAYAIMGILLVVTALIGAGGMKFM